MSVSQHFYRLTRAVWHLIVAALTPLVTGFHSDNASAWGPEGHGLVAAIAETHLEQRARTEAQRLLATENFTHLDEISSWADAVRASRPDTAPGHYVDIPLKAKGYSKKRDCHYDKDNNRIPELTCVVVMLPQWAAVLADKSKSDAERLEALKWVVHFAGDIHQPLHNEDNNDKGGNKVHVTYYGKSTELHAVWDGGVIEHNYGWSLGPNYSFDHQAVRAAAQDIDIGGPKCGVENPMRGRGHADVL